MNTQPHPMNDNILIQLLKSDKPDDDKKALEHIKMLIVKKDKISDEILVLMLKMGDADNIALKYIIELLKSDKSDDVKKALKHIKMLIAKKDKISDEILVLMLKIKTNDADNIASKYIIKTKQKNVTSKLRVPVHMKEDDIFNHALFELWKYLRKSDFDTSKKDSIERFLYIVCKRYTIRNSGKGDTDIDELPEPFEYMIISLMTREQREELRKIFDRLGAGCKDILSLKFFDGMSHKEITEKLNRKEGSTRTRYSQCLKKLKEWIAQDDDLAKFIRDLLNY